jgi:hypothetical protein
MSTGKQIRVLILLLVLAPLVMWAMSERDPRPDWDRPMTVAIYPYNVNNSEAVDQWLQNLEVSMFDDVDQFMAAHARKNGLDLGRPFIFHLAEPVRNSPRTPLPGANLVEQLRWALGMRWWLFRFDLQDLDPDIIILARFQGAEEPPFRMHSVGMPRPRLALVSQIADDAMIDYNNVIFAHELLHTVGATDLYEPETQRPTFPAGYVEPHLTPPYPQRKGELMAMQTPLAPGVSKEIHHLDQATIGLKTLQEIGWLRQ